MISPFLREAAQNGSMFQVQYGDTAYEYKCVLINPEGRFFVFRPGAIEQLYIEDSVDHYYAGGYILIKNTSDYLERPANTDDIQSVSYLFRGDSRDALRISIIPILQDTDATVDSEAAKRNLALDYDFIIYNIEEIQGEGATVKYRKLYFHDLYHQVLIEKHVPFSTAINNNNQRVSTPTRTMKTGTAIKQLLAATFPESEGFDVSFGSFEEGGSDIFFTAPAQYTAEMSLAYLLNRHVSGQGSNHDGAILQICRYPKQWELVSLKTIFDRAYVKETDAGGPLFIEKFMIGGVKDDTASTLTTVVERSPSIAMFLPRYGIIDNFTLIPPLGMYTQNTVVGSVVHSVDFKTGSFSVDRTENQFSKVKDTYTTNYVNNMKGKGGIPHTNLIGNRYRDRHQNVKHVFSTSVQSIQRLAVGRNEALRNAVLQNNAISFRVPGATYRQAGGFIAIDREDAIQDCEFDDKLLGIYLLANVKHLFISGEYTNEIVAVKTYNYDDIGATGEGYI